MGCEQPPKKPNRKLEKNSPERFVLLSKVICSNQRKLENATTTSTPKLEDFLGIEQIQSGPRCFSIYFDGDDMFSGVD